jgi:hemerythrin
MGTHIMVIDPKYSIGIDQMDAQHACWIELIEKFRSVGSGQLLERAGINAAAHALEHLLSFTKSHFASEEQLLVTHKYPDLETHKIKHRELEAAVVKLLSEIRAHATRSTPLKLNLFVTVWLLEHIMGEDDKYARFILGKPSRAVTRPEEMAATSTKLEPCGSLAIRNPTVPYTR